MQASVRGKLVSWKSDKGFGFIRPDTGGKDVFVHKRDFGNIGRSPQVGDLIRFQLMRDREGRPRAADVQVEGLPRASRQSRRSGRPAASHESRELRLALGPTAFAIAFACALVALTVLGNLPIILLPLYLVMSLLAFVLYAFDKSAAMNQRWRTSENTLLVAGLLGGWPGALIAQGLFRHKSRKMEFLVPFWITVLLNCAFLYWASTIR